MSALLVVALVVLCRDRLGVVGTFAQYKGDFGLRPYGGALMQGGLALDLKRLEHVSPVDPKRRTVDVGAGVIGEVLERKLNAQGWTLGHAPGSIKASTVGGWLATRSAGATARNSSRMSRCVTTALVTCRSRSS